MVLINARLERTIQINHDKANRGIWKLYHGSMPIVNTRVICQLWYMAVIPWLWLLHSLHSGQTAVQVSLVAWVGHTRSGYSPT